MPELTPDLTRCISVHWSLPAKCVLSKTHRANWHETWHPETGNRLRYRHTLGRTEEFHHSQWHPLDIPAPGAYGPDRIRIRSTLVGAELDTATHDRKTVETILDLLLDDHLDDFQEIAEQDQPADGHARERLLYERLVEQLVMRLPRTAPLNGPEVAAVAAELNDIARLKGLPQQRRTA